MKSLIIRIIAWIIAWRIKRNMKKAGFGVGKLGKERTILVFEDLINKELSRPSTKDISNIDDKVKILMSKLNISNTEDEPGKIEDDTYVLDEQDKRICKIFRVGEVPEVNKETIRRYKEYLKNNIDYPCYVSGVEDVGCFSWEEPYVLGFGNVDEYKELKKVRASYTDMYEIIRFDDKVGVESGVIAMAKRLLDGKIFRLPLSDLESGDDQSKNYQLIKDYSMWFENN
ncbi:hypothetical protein CCP3SC15_460017 [Gammaproteobacteria bacterium]